MGRKMIGLAAGLGLMLASVAGYASASGSLSLSTGESATITCSGGTKPNLRVSGENIGRHDTSREFTVVCTTK